MLPPHRRILLDNDQLSHRELTLITKLKRNMRNKLIPLLDLTTRQVYE
jgi:hypothetical protein